MAAVKLSLADYLAARLVAASLNEYYKKKLDHPFDRVHLIMQVERLCRMKSHYIKDEQLLELFQRKHLQSRMQRLRFILDTPLHSDLSKRVKHIDPLMPRLDLLVRLMLFAFQHDSKINARKLAIATSESMGKYGGQTIKNEYLNYYDVLHIIVGFSYCKATLADAWSGKMFSEQAKDILAAASAARKIMASSGATFVSKSNSQVFSRNFEPRDMCLYRDNKDGSWANVWNSPETDGKLQSYLILSDQEKLFFTQEYDVMLKASISAKIRRVDRGAKSV